MNAVLRLVPTAGTAQPVSCSVSATPSLSMWSSPRGDIRAVFDGPKVIRLRGNGLRLEIYDAVADRPFTGSYLFLDPVNDCPTFNSYETGLRYRITALHGAAEIVHGPDGRANVAVSGGDWEIAIEEIGTASPPFRPSRAFAACETGNRDAFRTYLESIAPWRTAETPAAELAAYVLWSATVSPAGFVTREAILMSKHWMDRVWSWDNCFNALALAPGLPAAALDQFMMTFDLQDPSGALPDMVGHSVVSYGYVKPPVQGWTLRALRPLLELEPSQWSVILNGLERQSRFWLDFRRRPGQALPYYQHGNDSGWDNSTVFDGDGVVESADLAVLLAIQLDVMAEIGDDLADARCDGWRLQRDALLTAVVDELWTDKGFAARRSDGSRPSDGSLLNLIPLVAHDLLPQAVSEAMAVRVEAFLTDHGLATETVDSPDYQSDGYWRGPVWGPPTVLIEDGLRSAGYVELADDISQRFRLLCEAEGFAENFDALTGRGLRDLAYTWTASCYLHLARAATLRQTPLV
ncbi:amylo-alpha-1,6-glucosidase [Frondihabitans sp. PAMC 28766]|uniref:amylo-alpha-1,6-glucosidase n=1 Tax=Frondihabitans sp. PAMC 28766 TaxID=1795630 RepID=UPI001EF3F2C2|nr:glycogen debranching protein [Frondihabitans sp. PAMC 28766]